MKLFKKWIRDYNHVAPHSGLGMKSPLEYRKFMDKVVWLKWGSGHFIFFIMLFIFNSCDTSDKSSVPYQIDNSYDEREFDYNVVCKCKGLRNIPITVGSTVSKEQAKLSAGAVCAALQPEKEIILKKDNMSEAEKHKLQSIIQQTLVKVLRNNVDISVLNTVYDCVQKN